MDKFTFVPMTEADLGQLQTWLARPHVNWPAPDTLDGLRDEYFPEDTYGAARPFIIQLVGERIGYIQSYVVAESGVEWWPDHPPPGAVGIDLFLASESRVGKGLGSALVAQFVANLFRDASVTQVRVDPRPDNPRAIGCFAKVGFQRVCDFTSPDGPAVLMTLDRIS